MRFVRIVGIVATVVTATPSQALDKVRFGTNWVAEAEHGGFYQAVTASCCRLGSSIFS